MERQHADDHSQRVAGVDALRERQIEHLRDGQDQQGQADGDQVEGHGALEHLEQRRPQADALDHPVIDEARHQAGGQDEALGRRRVEAVAARQQVERRRAAHVIDDHGDDEEAAQQVDAQVPAVIVDVARIRAILEGWRGPRPTARRQHHVIVAFVVLIRFGGVGICS